MRIALWVLVMFIGVPSFAAGALEILHEAAGGTWTAVFHETYWSLAGRSAKRFEVAALRQALAAKVFSDVGASGFELQPVVESMAARHYTFVPTLDGRRVDNVALTLSLDRDDFLIGLTARLRKLSAPVGGPILDNADIPARVQKMFLCEFADDDTRCNPLPLRPRPVAIPDVSERFLYVTEDGRVVNAYRVTLETLTGVGISTYVFNATPRTDGTLEQLERRSGLQPHRPRARIFDPNPNATLGDLSIDRNRLAEVKSRVYDRVSLSGVRPVSRNEPIALHGEFVRLDNSLISMDDPPVPTAADGSFFAYAGDLLFASAMAYYHIDWMQRYVQRLGFGRRLLAFPVPVDPQMFVLVPHSRTDTNSQKKVAILFGWVEDRNAFDAEDGDVVAHEYGHALQWGAAKTKFNSKDGDTFEVVAVREGFGDYWSMTMFHDRNRKYQQEGLHSECFAEWSQQNCTRIINLHARREDAGEDCDPYMNSSVWTAVLWQIAGELGRKSANRLVLESFFSVEDRPDFCGSAMALLRADQALTRGKNWGRLQWVFRQRQIFGAGNCQPRR